MICPTCYEIDRERREMDSSPLVNRPDLVFYECPKNRTHWELRDRPPEGVGCHSRTKADGQGDSMDIRKALKCYLAWTSGFEESALYADYQREEGFTDDEWDRVVTTLKRAAHQSIDEYPAVVDAIEGAK